MAAAWKEVWEVSLDDPDRAEFIRELAANTDVHADQALYHALYAQVLNAQYGARSSYVFSDGSFLHGYAHDRWDIFLCRKEKKPPEIDADAPFFVTIGKLFTPPRHNHSVPVRSFVALTASQYKENQRRQKKKENMLRWNKSPRARLKEYMAKAEIL